jgi:hypothetical protein
MIRSLNIQFHMLIDELIDFVSEVSSRYQLQVELERFYPKMAHELPLSADLTEEVRQFGHVDRIWFLYKTLKSKRTEKFMLNIGRQKDNQLEQSQLGAGARTEEGYEILKRVAHDLKHRTAAGVWVIGATGHVGYYKKFRISERAAKTARAGKVELTGIGFELSFRVDPPEIEETY